MRRRREKPPKWKIEHDCRKCDNIREIHDPKKRRDGDYCIACLERREKRLPSPVLRDEINRVLRCECFTHIQEDDTEAKI